MKRNQEIKKDIESHVISPQMNRDRQYDTVADSLSWISLIRHDPTTAIVLALKSHSSWTNLYQN